MADALTIVAGVDNDPVIFEVFEDDAQTQRTDFTGWVARFVAFNPRTGAAYLDTRSDAGDGLLTLADATDGPAGQWIVLNLPAATSGSFLASGEYTLVLVNEADNARIRELIEPTSFTLHKLRFAP